MTQCSSCNKPVYRSATSSPDGPICRECRKRPDRVCLWCSKGFHPRRTETVFCSQSCSSHWRWRSEKVAS
jgi:hypothetical protein